MKAPENERKSKALVENLSLFALTSNQELDMFIRHSIAICCRERSSYHWILILGLICVS